MRGLDDATVEATGLVMRSFQDQRASLLTLLVGAKILTGASGPLDEKAAIAAGESPTGHVHSGSGPQTLVHPHDLTLGGGSIDPLAGITGFVRTWVPGS